MGWLFAVALGLYRNSRRVVLVSLVPIAARPRRFDRRRRLCRGLSRHGGRRKEASCQQILSGVLLIAWGLFHLLYGHRHHGHVGLTTGLFGLGVWSFVMATAHGAGVMLIPVLMPLEHAAMAGQAGEHAHHMPATTSLWIATLAVLVHSLAMLITTGIVALIVYQWTGLDFLKRGWINLDLIWSAALIGIGAWLLLA